VTSFTGGSKPPNPPDRGLIIKVDINIAQTELRIYFIFSLMVLGYLIVLANY
jgi:hypothetical protein